MSVVAHNIEKRERFARLARPCHPIAAPGQHSQAARKARERNPPRHANGQLMDMFMKADLDGSGELNRNEFKALLKSLDLGLGNRQLEAVIDECDLDGDDVFEYKEVVPALTRVLQKMAKVKKLDDFVVAARSSGTQWWDGISKPSAKLCWSSTAQEYPPPLHVWLEEQGILDAEAGFHDRGYHSLDQLALANPDATELRKCGLVQRSQRGRVLVALNHARTRLRELFPRTNGRPVSRGKVARKTDQRVSRLDLWRAS